MTRDVGPTDAAEIESGIRLMVAASQAIRDAGPAGLPGGHLYAAMMGRMTLAGFESMIRLLTSNGLVAKRGDLLVWVAD